MTSPIIELKLGRQLKLLFEACEKFCVAGCCGIDAFDFSPLYIASHMATFSGQISENDLQVVEKEIDELVAAFSTLTPNKDGFICSIECTNQYFRKYDFDKLISQLRKNIRLAPKVLDYANNIQKDS